VLNPSRPPRSKHRKGKNWQKLSAKENASSSTEATSQRSQSLRLNNQSSNGSSSSWMVTRTAEFVDPRDILITDCDELQIMDAFILRKVCEMDEQKRKSSKESMVDVVFKQALKEFKSNLISTYSVGAQDGHLRLTYKNLIDHFEQVSHLFN
jgi:myosin-9